MIVCLCNGLSERDITAVVERHPGITVGDVYRRLGCRVSCGKCVPFVAELVQAARTAPLIGPGPGDLDPHDASGAPRRRARAA
jgi:bacterioferritin-associated ferredoxin